MNTSPIRTLNQARADKLDRYDELEADIERYDEIIAEHTNGRQATLDTLKRVRSDIAQIDYALSLLREDANLQKIREALAKWDDADE